MSVQCYSLACLCFTRSDSLDMVNLGLKSGKVIVSK